MNAHVRPFFSHRLAAEINVDDCREYRAHRRKLGIKDSWDFAFEVMQRAHVAVTPGRDFGVRGMENFIRFSTANSMAQLQEAASRLRTMLGQT